MVETVVAAAFDAPPPRLLPPLRGLRDTLVVAISSNRVAQISWPPSRARP